MFKKQKQIWSEKKYEKTPEKTYEKKTQTKEHTILQSKIIEKTTSRKFDFGARNMWEKKAKEQLTFWRETTTFL